MAYRVELTDRALRDLSIIYEHIRAESSEQAARWFDRFEKAIFSLGKYPNRAPLTPEDSTARHLLYGRKPYVYRIIFQVDDKTSTVHVLLNAGQDATGRKAVNYSEKPPSCANQGSLRWLFCRRK